MFILTPDREDLRAIARQADERIGALREALRTGRITKVACMRAQAAAVAVREDALLRSVALG